MKNNKQAFLFYGIQTRCVSLLILVFLSPTAQADIVGSKARSKSQFNAQVFEKDEDQQSFKSQVKLIREMAGETQVFFTDRPGFFRLSDKGSLQNILIKAQKAKKPVDVTVDLSNRVLLDVKDFD